MSVKAFSSINVIDFIEMRFRITLRNVSVRTVIGLPVPQIGGVGAQGIRYRKTLHHAVERISPHVSSKHYNIYRITNI